MADFGGGFVPPINYQREFTQVNPVENLLRGVQAGAFIQQANAQAEADAQARAVQAAFAQDMAAFQQNPTPDSARNLMLKYPGMEKVLKPVWEGLTNEQKDAQFSATGQVWHALSTGNKETALSVLDERIAAMKNSKRDTKELERLRAGIEGATDTTKAANDTLAVMSLLDPDRADKVMKAKLTAEKAPAELTEAQAKAAEAAVKAKFAESNAVMDLQKKGWDITKIQEDIAIAKQNARIAAMNAAIAREGNTLKRQELQLKINDEQTKRDDAVRAKAYEATSAMNALDTAINLSGSILSDEDTLRAAVGQSGWRGWLPGTQARTMAGKIEQLSNVLAAENLDKMKGAMSDKDILFLKNIQANLDRFQDEDQFIAEIRRVDAALKRSKPLVAQKYGIPMQTTTTAQPGTLSTPSTNAKGWKLMQDAKGNRAYVSPDGKQFEAAP